MTRKFKLIKTYPSSPPLGLIVEEKPNGGYAMQNSSSYWNTKDKIEGFPEFWEEIVEYPVGTKVIDTNPETKGYTYEKQPSGKWKLFNCDGYTIDEKNSIGDGKRFVVQEETEKKDYEILSLISEGRGLASFDESTDLYSTPLKKIYFDRKYWVNCFLSYPQWKIHSVKRLSDGEIFSVGDNTNEGVIKEFQLCKDERIIISFVDGLPRYLDAKGSTHVLKLKKPIFKTEDGGDVYNGDTYTRVNTNCWTIFEHTAGENTKLNKGTLAFNDKNLAEEYLWQNKPCLSFNDVQDVLEKASRAVCVDFDKILEKLKNIIHNKN